MQRDTKTSTQIGTRLKLMAGLSAAFLFLLIAFATRYQVYLAQLEQSTGILELLAAAIPLLSLVMAALLSRQPVRSRPSNPASRRRPGSSARR